MDLAIHPMELCLLLIISHNNINPNVNRPIGWLDFNNADILTIFFLEWGRGGDIGMAAFYILLQRFLMAHVMKV